MPPRTPRIAAALRRIRLLLSRRRLLPRGGSGLPWRGRFPFRRRLLDAPQRGFEVVEDQADRRIRTRRRGDARLALTDDEHTALAGRDLQLGQPGVAGLELFGSGEQLGGRSGQNVSVPARRAGHLALLVEDDC